MKKRFAILFLFFFSIFAFCQQKENPFNSIMGMKWNTNAAEFKKNFQHELQVFAVQKELFFRNFELGDMVIDTMTFVFKSKEKDLEFTETNFGKFFLSSAYMDIKSDQFDSLLDIFKVKYGKPTNVKNHNIQNKMGANFKQSEVTWKNGNRLIILHRYSNNLDNGLCLFSSINNLNENLKSIELLNKEAADQL